MKTAERAYYLDWLRVGIVASLIPHHAAITFSHLGDAYVYQNVPSQALYYFLQSTFLNLWFMRALFCISGISTYYALKRRTYQEYFIERIRRLLLPTIFAILFVCPITGYLRAITSYHFTGSFLHFYSEFFRGFIARYLGWGHFWFLVYLFVYSTLLLVCLSISRVCVSVCERLGRFLAVRRHIFLPMLLFIFLEALFRPFFPGYQNLYADWANFTVYLSFFLLGYVLAHSKDALKATSAFLPVFLGLSGFATLLFMVGKYASGTGTVLGTLCQENPYAFRVILAILQAIAEFAWVMFFIGVGQKYFNKSHPILAYLSKTSFALYIFHYVILSTILYALLGTALPHYASFVFASGSTYAVFFLLFELLIKRVAILRYVCGVKTPSA